MKSIKYFFSIIFACLVHTSLCLSVNELIKQTAVKEDLTETQTATFKALKLSVTTGNCKDTKNLLQNGADPNLRTDESLLTKAMMKGDLEITKLLLENGAPATPEALEIAVTTRNVPAVEILLKYGANPNLRTDKSLLTVAIMKADLKIIKLLLEHGALATPEALEIAVTTGNLPAVEILLKYGANPNLSTNKSLLIIAILKGNVTITELLLEYGADPNQSYEIKDQEKLLVPIDLAVEKGVEMKELLISYGALLNETKTETVSVNDILYIYNFTMDSIDQLSPEGKKQLLDLDLDFEKQHHLIEFLISDDVFVKDNLKQLLIFTIEVADLNLLQKILDTKIDPTNDGLIYAFLKAIDSNNFDIVKLLIKYGVDPESCSIVDGEEICAPYVVEICKDDRIKGIYVKNETSDKSVTINYDQQQDLQYDVKECMNADSVEITSANTEYKAFNGSVEDSTLTVVTSNISDDGEISNNFTIPSNQSYEDNNCEFNDINPNDVEFSSLKETLNFTSSVSQKEI